MTADMPDPVKVAREAVAELCGALKHEVLAGKKDNDPPMLAARAAVQAMQAAMAGRGVREDYAAICKELGCIEKPGVPLRFIQEMRKNLTAAGERIDWLLRSWDDATITERQELDRMRRGWGPTTPTERMLRHRDLRDCMQALSGALTDLTTPEDDNADPEVEARLQEAYDRVNKRYLASLEILRRLDEPLERPDLEPAGEREGAYDPERDLEPCLEARLFVTPESLDAFMEANPLPPEPTHAPDATGLVSLGHLVTYKDGRSEFFPPSDTLVLGQGSGSVAWVTDGEEAADTIAALQAEVERLRQAVRNDTATIGQYEEHRQKLHAARTAAEARATAAEAERDAQRSKIEELSVELAECERRLDADYQREGVADLIAERDALKAEVERKDKALREAGEAIAEYFRYLNGGETRGSYDGKPEREGLRKAGYAVSRALAPAKAGG